MLASNLKALAAAQIPGSLSPVDRERLGENWVSAPNVSERCDGRDPQEGFIDFLAGWALLEKLAWSPASDERVAAAAALYDRLRNQPFTSEVRDTVKFLERNSFAPLLGHHRGKLDRQFDRAFCLGR